MYIKISEYAFLPLYTSSGVLNLSADIFLNKLPYKEDSIINENANNLSGGQRQRLCIARALFKKPEILILDEATSSLDSETEKNLTYAIKKLRGKSTILVIAHRLSTVKEADIVLYMENGKIIAKGSFEIGRAHV